MRTVRGRISMMGAKKARDGREFTWIKLMLDGARPGALRHFIAFPYNKDGTVCCEGPLDGLRVGLEVYVDYEDGSSRSGFAKKIMIAPKRKPKPSPQPEPVVRQEPEVRELLPEEWAALLCGTHFQETPTWEEVRDLLKGDPRLRDGAAIFHKIAYACWCLFDKDERN